MTHASEPTTQPLQTAKRRPFVARMVYRFSVPIILVWLAIAFFLTTAVPSLELVEKENAVEMNPIAAPSFQAMQRMGEVFGEANSGAVAMIVLEGEEPLGDDAHAYYNELIRELRADTTHVQHVQDFWGDAITEAAAQSADGKATYVQVNLTANRDGTSANDSVRAVREIVERTSPPPGVQAYVTGPAAFAADLGPAGNRTVALVTSLSFTVIFTMLLLVYRSVITVALLLVIVVVELLVARGTVALLGDLQVIGITTFVVNLLVPLAIAAGTDYGIFFTGRYQEARQAGEDRESAFYTTYHSVAKVVVASGLTIAGAVLCLRFTRLPVYQTLGVPTAVGMVAAVLVAVTLVPAVIAAGSRIRLFEPKRKLAVRRWRRIGTAIVRWPAPILAATLAISLIGLLALPGYQASYNDQKYLPQDIPASVGYAAAERHFPQSLMMAPDILLVEADHDMRNPADFLVLNKLAKAVQAVEGVSRVQAITRPGGEPLNNTTIPFMLSMSSASQSQLIPFQRARMDDLLVQADDMLETIAIMQRMQALTEEMVDTTHEMVANTHELEDITNRLRDNVANFDDFFRPIRNYLYWEPHCYNIPLCFAVRSVFDTLDGVDQITVKLRGLVENLDRLDQLLPQMAEQFPVALDIFVRGLRAGHPVAAALDLLTHEMSDPIGSEFGIVTDEVAYGADLRDALHNMANRCDLDDLRMFVVSLSVQSETGGNLAEILENLSRVIRDRASMMLMVRALSSEGRMTATILTALPVLAFVALFLLNPPFYLQVANDPAFSIGFGCLIALYAVGFIIIRRLVNLKV